MATTEHQITLNGREFQRQLTFDVPGMDKDGPEFGSLVLSGRIPLFKDLNRKQTVHIRVTDDQGEVLVDKAAEIIGVNFKDTEDKDGWVTTERIHTAKLG